MYFEDKFDMIKTGFREMDFGIFWQKIENGLSCSISFPTHQS
jgi:hypothetical protein